MRDRTWIVALAAALWGLDGLLREPLATSLAPATIVLWEHLVAVAILLPFLGRAFRAFSSCSTRSRWAIVAIGVGSSAGATALFTQAFALAGAQSDFITPLVLQKLQPLIAVLLAVVVLKERIRWTYALFAIPALAGAWLVAFPRVGEVGVQSLGVALLSVGAAALWAAGTVLGRLVAPSVGALELTTLRLSWGLPAALLIVAITGAPLLPPAGDVPALVALAVIPGLGALCLYYFGLRATAASRATIAELAFPATAAVVGVTFLHSTMSPSQWVGLAILMAAVAGLGWHERVRAPAVVVPPLDDVVLGRTPNA